MATGGLPFVSSTFSRVTSQLTKNVMMGNISAAQRRMLLSEEQIATGLRLTRTSVDAVGSNKVIDFQIRMNRSDQFVRNINTNMNRLTMADSTLGDANNIINRAKSIALEQVQSTSSTSSRSLAAQEVNELLKQAMNIANTQFEGKYIYAGSNNTTPPMINAGGGLAFLGNNSELLAQISEGLQVAGNVKANDAFGVLSDGIKGINMATLATIDMNPSLTLTTKLSALRGGEGVSVGSLSITGSATSIIDLGIARNIGDIVDLINSHVSGTGVTASINPGTNGLSLTRAGGGNVVVSEVNGGKTAKGLGLLTTSAGMPSPLIGADINPSVTKDTLIGELNNGLGISASGLTITNVSNGTTFAASLDPSIFAPTRTIESMLNEMNHSGTFVNAEINVGGTGINVSSRLSGGRLTITENSVAGTTASDLGILSTLRRAKVSDLNGGLGVDSVEGADIQIIRKDGQAVLVDIDNAKNVQEIANAISNDPLLSATVNSSNGIEITDSSVGGGDLQILNFNGSFAATNLGIQGTVTNAPGPITLSGTSVTFVGVQPEGIFTALINLRDALNNDNTEGITAANQLFDEAQNKVLSSRSKVGASMGSIEMTMNRLEIEKLELEKMISQIRDIDIAEAISQFQLQQVILQAGLSVASRALQTSLLNFL